MVLTHCLTQIKQTLKGQILGNAFILEIMKIPMEYEYTSFK